MHTVIRAIVYGKDEADALNQARRVFDGLTENQRSFDYYVMFGVEDDNSEMSGTARWGALPTVAPATSLSGQQLIAEGLRFTEEDFERHLDKVKEGAFKSAAELMTDDQWRYNCYKLGQYHGSAVWLYDHDGEGVRDRRHLDNALNKWRCLYEDRGQDNPAAEYSVWVVPADVHF